MYKVDLVYFIILLILMFNFIIHIMSVKTIIIKKCIYTGIFPFNKYNGFLMDLFIRHGY